MSGRYKIPDKEISRMNIHKDLISAIKKTQKKLQMKENLKYGRKSKKVSFKYASKEVAKYVR